MDELRKRVAVQALDWKDEAAVWLALNEDVSIAEMHRGVIDSPTHEIFYRFTLPTGTDLDWDPSDGWDGPSAAMDAMAAWVAHLVGSEFPAPVAFGGPAQGRGEGEDG